ncbi:hypothetical protein CGCS363_v014156 [Colletotrichum siamense]|uniref:uncharacterized protein n=1 Tax=Colletotrichum siamense TaxID=690259 RepID=UPI00187224DC|nr:uncharacterized protein CGCS363_v014156 [Colletotrichum siamense]KAF5484482.1 hypothetical protein CGCS363_v014156 [Colletotrichum siamense]
MLIFWDRRPDTLSAPGCSTQRHDGNSSLPNEHEREQPPELSHSMIQRHAENTSTDIDSLEEGQKRNGRTLVRNLESLGLTLESEVAEKVARNSHGMSPMERLTKELQDSTRKSC